MLFPRSVRLPLFVLLLAPVLSGHFAAAQVTGEPAPAPPAQSSSSDVQTATIAQKTADMYKKDVAVSVFAQYTNRSNGNSIRLDTTSSGGGMLSYRQSPRWWFGYEINYGVTKYTDSYQKGAYRVAHTTNEFTGAYLIKSPRYRGVQGFLTVGGGVIVHSPNSYGGPIAFVPGTPSTEANAMFTFSAGVQRDFTEHLGLRLQYRDDTYKAPDFGQVPLDLHRLRSSTEPSAGVYYRF